MKASKQELRAERQIFWKGNGGSCSKNFKGLFHHDKYLSKKVGVDGVPGGLFCHHCMDDQWSLTCISWLKFWKLIQLYFHRLIHCV